MLERDRLCQVIRTFATFSFFVILIGGLFITNMSPVWMYWVLYAFIGGFIVCTLLWILQCRSIPRWES
ncbi:MAG: hypothetical protein KAR33_06750 [Candidatus Thorarchaeota archaeon]|nr:hypothetical protein [Candidatus Thorarchaeota archaeon]